MEEIKKEKEIIWVQILYLFIIPSLLLYFDVVPDDFRIPMLFVIAILLYGIIKHEDWSFHDIGIKRNFMKDIVPYSIFTLGGVFFLIWLAQIAPHEPFLNWWKDIKFLFLFIPISIVQEIVFRGILMKKLQTLFTNPVFIIILNAILFSLIHIIYFNLTFVLPMTFMAGIGFAWMYYKYKNLILISISHTILNFTAMILGFFIIR